MNTPTLRRILARSTILAGFSGAALAGAAALAQDADEEEGAEERIVVTGSRIQASNLTSSSPITSVGTIDLSLSNTVNAEQFLNTLPQTVPGFDSSSNNPGLGESTVDLRGLGSERTLVLVNGRRYVSSNQNAGVVDLNTIPAQLVEQVDILTGGASAIYGSDAVSGVVNFILKDDFNGAEWDASYEVTEEGDGAIWNTDVTLGSDFADGRGNAVFTVGYSSRESVLQGDRDEAFFTLLDGGADAGFRETGSVNIPSTFVLDFSPNYTEALGIQPPCNVEGTELSDDGFCTTDSFGFIFTPEGPGVDVFVNSGPNTNRYNYAPVNFLQIPQERYNLFSNVTYEITPSIEAYGQAVFVSSQTEQLLAPSPVFTTLTVNLDNPFLAGDTESLALLTALSTGDSDGNGVADAVFEAGRRMEEVGGRLADIRNDTFQIQGGLRGDFNETWAWDIFGSFGEASSTVSQSGNIDVAAYQATVREGRANIFEAGGLTDEIVDEISVLGVISGVTQTSIISGIVSGDFGEMGSPFADSPIGVAFGAEYRDESLRTAGAGLGDGIAGFNVAPTVSGQFDVYEIFAETNVPLVEGAAFAEEITLTGAFRYSDYSTVGGTETYAGGVSWTPIEGLRFRGQYQRAVRAPNIGELFSPQTNGFPNIADPCAGGDNGGFDGSETTRQNCIAQGVPAAQIGQPFQVNAQIEGLFGGNPDLAEETADTITLGAIYEPSFIDNLAITIDYYDIEIEDVIGNVPAQTIFDLCFVEGVDAFCQNITRNPSGVVDIFNSTSQNSAALSATGVDITVDYSYDLEGFGTFGIYSLIGWNEENVFQALPTSDPIDCVGFYGSTCGEPIPEWNFNTRFDWSMGPWGARLRWQRISSVDDDAFNSVINPSGEVDLFVEGVDAYDQFDLTGFYTFSNNLAFRIGVENLTDEDYTLIGDGSAEQSNTFPATYDTLGRTWFAGLTVSF